MSLNYSMLGSDKDELDIVSPFKEYRADEEGIMLSGSGKFRRDD